MAVERGIPYLLSPVKEGYWGCPSYDVEHPAPVQAPYEVPHRSTLYLYHCMRADESKEELQSYYKLTEEDLEEITKDWPAELLIPADPAELSDPELIDSPEATREEHDTPGTSRRKKTEEVQQLSSASEETASESPG
jgi:hypothetical protein